MERTVRSSERNVQITHLLVLLAAAPFESAKQAFLLVMTRRADGSVGAHGHAQRRGRAGRTGTLSGDGRMRVRL